GTSPSAAPGGGKVDTPDLDGPASPDAPNSPDGVDGTPGGSHPGDGSLRDGSADPRDTATEPVGRCGRKEPIDAATGEMFLVQTDVELAGLLPLVLERTHVSSYRSGRLFGPSWASTLDQRLELDAQGVCYAGPSGVILVYPDPPADGAPVLPAAGARWPLSRDGDGFVIRQPDTGRTLRFGAPAGRTSPLETVTDRNGHRLDFEHDQDGVVTAVRHSGGYHVVVDSENGLVTELRLRPAEGADITLVRFGYAGSRLVEVLNSSGRPMRFTYDQAGRIVRWDDRGGEWYGYEYDHNGRCVRTDGSGGMLSGTFAYDPENRTTVETDSLGHIRTYHFDELHQLVREIDQLGHQTRYEWAGHGRLTAKTDPTGRTTRYAYDEDGNLATVTRPDGTQTLAEYNDFGLPLVVVQPDGGVWRREYDPAGNLLRTTDPAGAVRSYTYDEHGLLTSVTDPSGTVRVIETDAAGLPVRVHTGDGVGTSCTRDQFGRIASVTDAAGATTRLTWTVEGRLRTRTLPSGAVERWRYDAEGNHVERVDALGAATRVETTHFGLPKVRTEADGSRLEYFYDTELRITAVRNAARLTWHYEYDAAGHLLRETDFDGRRVSYIRDPAGRILSKTNGAGQTTTFERDAVGNVVERRSPGNVATFAYDPMGRLLRAANSDAEVVYERDQAGRVVAEAVNGRAVRSAYDAAGRRVRRITPTGAESTWEFDAASRPVALHAGGHRMSFGYDTAGHEVERLLDTGTVLAQSWDADHRLTSQTVSSAASAGMRVVQRREYRYRPDGQLAEIEDLLLGTRRLHLDAAGRVTGVDSPAGAERYAYDRAGNLTMDAVPGDPPSPRQFAGTLLRATGRVRYEHDAQGRVVLRQKKRLSAKPDTWRYTWDAEDRLVAVVTPDGSRWRYAYDPLGRRIAKQRLGHGGAVVEQVDFIWDGTTLAEQVHNGVDATTWDWEPGKHRPLVQTRRARDASQGWIDREFYSIVTDLVGAPTELVDEHGGLAWQHQTTLWGEALGRLSGRAGTPLRFPGQYFDAETGLHYNYQRYYDPATGRYVSHDPLGLAPSPNTQGYVRNPTGWIDPLGLEGCTFQNQQPDQLNDELEVMRRNGVEPTTPGTPEFDAMIAQGDGQLKWVVTADGDLRVAPHNVNGDEISHAAIAGGGPVRAAGQANVAGSSDAGYFGLEIDNHSGHYLHNVQQDPDAIIEEGVNAFGQHGVMDGFERNPIRGSG
ncbi:RHS repeat-associated core domain-containing protein, partial [Amycolatopsis endophytica]